MQALETKNKKMLKYLQEYGKGIKEEKKRQKAEEKAMGILYNLRKTHYLLSTEVRDGIYNSPSNPRPCIEAALKSVSPLSSTERKIIANKSRAKRRQSAVVGIPTIKENALDEVRKAKDLPALLKTKPQGPFRRPESVREQRLKGSS